MKKLLFICFTLFTAHLLAQNNTTKKPTVIDFHAFYNDFNTAQLMKTNSLGNVLSNKLWSPLSSMQVGLGMSYLKGITKRIDAVGTIDGSYLDYLFANGTSNGSSQFLLTSQVSANVKLLTDKHPVVPFLSVGMGFSIYDGNTGIYIPTGLGLQFNIFTDAYVFTNAQYRFALSNNINDHYNYSVGIGTPICNTKKPIVIKPIPILPVVETVITPEVKAIIKTISISVIDEATGQPLPSVIITLDGPGGKKLSGTSDANGKVLFNEMPAANYSVSGILNNINTSTKNISLIDFSNTNNEISINITHNDPRFTLAGIVVNKTTNKPEGNVDVTATNITQNSINTQQSKMDDGSFNIQLDANSDFSIVGRKASYLSNIEKASTKGLNRSTSLYLKLELDVQEVTASKNIVLNNINFESGKTNFNIVSSSDLNKLIQFLKDNPLLKLEIQGHTDNVGTVSGNMKLSQARANSIVAYLIKNGIENNKLNAKGYGSNKPIANNGTPEGKAQNRRVEMKLIN